MRTMCALIFSASKADIQFVFWTTLCSADLSMRRVARALSAALPAPSSGSVGFFAIKSSAAAAHSASFFPAHFAFIVAATMRAAPAAIASGS